MRLRRLEWTYKDCPIYYLTLVAHDRKALFASRSLHAAFIAFAEEATHHGVAVGRYVLMPDHIHLFAAFGLDSPNISAWVKSLKNALSKYLRSNDIPGPHWHKGFFDHILRSEESYDQKWEYVRLNPVRAGLVNLAEDWECQGEILPLSWLETSPAVIDRRYSSERNRVNPRAASGGRVSLRRRPRRYGRCVSYGGRFSRVPDFPQPLLRSITSHR